MRWGAGLSECRNPIDEVVCIGDRFLEWYSQLHHSSTSLDLWATGLSWKLMKIVVYNDEKQVKTVDLPGDVDNYDIVISSSVDAEFPQTSRKDDPPTIPEIDPEEIDTKTSQDLYRRMKNNEDTQAAEIRKIIYQWDVLTREQLDAWADKQGYSSRGGGIQGALVTLEDVTQEIKRKGGGDEQMIFWIGDE